MNRFDWDFEGDHGRVIPNKRFQDWQPKITGGRLEALESKEIKRMTS